MESSKLVVKDNALIDASFNLSLVEHRLLLLAIIEARKINTLTASTPIEISAHQYTKQFNIHEKESYKALKNACDFIFERRFSYVDRYKGDKLIKKVRWVSEVGYVENKGIVLIYLSDTVIGLISRLEEQFTKYHLNQVSSFKSKYSIRIYELIIKWLSTGITQKYEINSLRSKLGLNENEYKTMSLFKSNVLDKAINEINTKTDLHVIYDQFKQGRSITHIQFKLNNKKDLDTNDNKHVLTDKQIDMFSDKLSKSLSFQNDFKADIGVDLLSYRLVIAEKLKEPIYVKLWKKHLIEVGFKN